jgi:hypothetical protein
MAKELPYFQFEPAEYLTKDISFCSLSAQGLFINICSYYWQRQCDLSKEQFLRRFNYVTEFDELVKEGVIDVKDGIINVKFLDFQYLKATEKSTINSSNGAKGGRPKKPIKSESKPKINPNESESKGIREEDIKEYKIKEIKNRNEIFYTDLLSSQSWLESLAMQNTNKFNVTQIKTKLLAFKNEIDLKFDVKVNKNEFASHFVSWLNKQENKSKPKYISPA